MKLFEFLPSRYRVVVPLVVAIVLLGVGAYWFLQQSNVHAVATESEKTKVLYWYDPMVPNQHFDKPGKSPFMDMQLIAKYADQEDTNGQNNSSVTINANTRQNLGLRTEQVVLQKLTPEIRAAGYIAMDEHRVYSVPVRSSGYMEKLLAKAVGDEVQAGQKVAEVFAPELLIAQREYLSLLTSPSSPQIDNLRASSIHKLQRLGMADEEIREIAERGTPLDRVGVYAPVSGFVSGHVINIDLREGAKVESGQSIMLIADLNRVWQIIEIPEREAARINVGQKAEIRLASAPDAIITGEVDYLYPEIDAATRSLRARISLANPKHQLRPGQYAETIIHTASQQKILTVSSAAIIRTGVRNVVIVQENDHFRPADVTIGNEQNGRTEILSGLKEGENVVSSGQFLVDSEASLSGVLARLTPAGAQP